MPQVLDSITPLSPNDDYLIFDTKYGNTAEVVRSEAARLAISKQRMNNKIVIQADVKPYRIYLGSVIGNTPSWDFLGFVSENGGVGGQLSTIFDGGNSKSKYSMEQNLDGGDSSSTYTADQELDFGKSL